MKGKQYERGKQWPLVLRYDVVLMQLMHPDLTLEITTEHSTTHKNVSLVKAGQIRQGGLFQATV